ncbi:unnamed protein product [Pedinophyceae sp. YPF-701]|nr:unnamed protein product [Pedinophyceae sp. YPF-701]
MAPAGPGTSRGGGVDAMLAQMRRELSCEICGQLFRDPHTVPGCGHSYCYACIMGCIQGVGAKRAECPGCKLPVWKNDLVANIQYKNLAETFEATFGSTADKAHAAGTPSRADATPNAAEADAMDKLTNDMMRMTPSDAEPCTTRGGAAEGGSPASAPAPVGPPKLPSFTSTMLRQIYSLTGVAPEDGFEAEIDARVAEIALSLAQGAPGEAAGGWPDAADQALLADLLDEVDALTRELETQTHTQAPAERTGRVLLPVGLTDEQSEELCTAASRLGALCLPPGEDKDGLDFLGPGDVSHVIVGGKGLQLSGTLCESGEIAAAVRRAAGRFPRSDLVHAGWVEASLEQGVWLEEAPYRVPCRRS